MNTYISLLISKRDLDKGVTMTTIIDDDLLKNLICIICRVVMAPQIPENDLFKMLYKPLDPFKFVNNPQISLGSSQLKVVTMATSIDGN